jgi:hypothetical protein
MPQGPMTARELLVPVATEPNPRRFDDAGLARAAICRSPLSANLSSSPPDSSIAPKPMIGIVQRELDRCSNPGV